MDCIYFLYLKLVYQSRNEHEELKVQKTFYDHIYRRLEQMLQWIKSERIILQ